MDDKNQEKRDKFDQHTFLQINKRKTYILIIFVIVAAIFSFSYIRNLIALHNVRKENYETVQKLKRERKQNKRLKQEEKQLHNSDYLGQLIRAKYLYSKNGELIYNLPNDSK